MMRSGTTLFVAALLLQMPAARTAPLDKEGCANLKTEQGQLEHAGVRGNMAKGPQWAKANLEPEKLNQIRRLLEVDEQLLFRCQGKALVTLPKDLTDPDPAAREPGADGAKAGKAAKAPKEVAKKDAGKKEAVKKAAAPPGNPATKAEAGTAPPEKKPPAAKKKAKQKDDAYRPPGEAPSANPFANQLQKQ